MNKLEKYEKITYSFKIPVTSILKDNKAEALLDHSVKCIIPIEKDLQSSSEKIEGHIDCEAIFHIKLNKRKVYEVVQDDNDFNLTLTKSNWNLNGIEISDPVDNKSFYSLNSGDPLFDAVYNHLNKKLELGELDELITRNDGDPWTRDEAILALEIYMRTAHSAEYSEQMDMIKAYIMNGYLNRSLPSVRMMVHGMCNFDEDHENSGLTNLGKVFKEVWDDYQAGKIQLNLNRSL